ncbi:mechanosensitive ion channel family protein [Lacticigenium naphthae]|uniref:mechanosensitive ion channel family protein n=1 Tax=Lacticigenium naphthae TaxID=515351 RepID=UPI0003F6DD93|nr:mechanosensitive ion channel domain-containing protein [Lacticigenium naphthae]
MNQFSEAYQTIETFSWSYWLIALIGLILLFFAYTLAKRAVLRFTHSEQSKRLWLSLVNWLSSFAFLTFILTYFLESRLIYSPLFKIGNSSISMFLIIIVVFVLVLAFRLSKLIEAYVLPSVYDKYNLDRGIRFTFNTMVHYFIMIIALLFSLNSLGFNLSSLTVFAGVLGVGLGFGLQNIASNFISGIILLFERPIKVGDRVIIDDIIGDVDRIKMRATIVKTLDNERIIIPNSFFLEEKVINRSYGDTRLRLVIPVGVSYASDVEHVRDLLVAAAEEERANWPEIMIHPESFVFFVGFGDSSLDFKLFVWINDPEKEFQIKSALHFTILRKFREAEIEIPFPQRDLHLIK